MTDSATKNHQCMLTGPECSKNPDEWCGLCPNHPKLPPIGSRNATNGVTSTHNLAAITCPHCGYAHDAQDMESLSFDAWALAPNEGRESMACFQCDREFWVQGSYKPQYSTAVSEEELQ